MQLFFTCITILFSFAFFAKGGQVQSNFKQLQSDSENTVESTVRYEVSTLLIVSGITNLSEHRYWKNLAWSFALNECCTEALQIYGGAANGPFRHGETNILHRM